MRKANSSVASICGTNLSERANRGFSWVTCAITESFSKVLPKLLLHFTILFTLAGFFPSAYAGNYVPGSCQYGTSTPQEFCELFMGHGSTAYLTTLNGNSQFFDCSVPGCPYPNVDLSPGNGACWTYNQRGWVAACTLATCPVHASGTPCACDTGYKFDDAGTSCVPNQVTCPVLPLTHPPFSDACSTSLEQGKGVDVNNKCDPLTDDMQHAASCIADKINKLSSPAVNPKYTNPSATVRTAAYQDHLLEIWTKSQQLDTIMNSVVYTPETKQACAATYAAVNKEKAEHGIKHQPSSAADAAPHVERRAIDIPSSIVDSLTDQVTIEVTTYSIVNGERKPTTTITSDVEDYMNSKTINPSPACQSSPYINWGGRFDTPDWVHFYID